MPACAARDLSIRCTLSGTFLTWIMRDMLLASLRVYNMSIPSARRCSSPDAPASSAALQTSATTLAINQITLFSLCLGSRSNEQRRYGNMIRLTYVLRRRPGMSLAEFQDYWRNTHGPLVARH